MQKWRITGADASTGADKSLEINAADEPAARDAARMLGMLVSHVTPLPDPAGPVLQYRTPGLRNLSASIPPATLAPDPAPPQLPYNAVLASASATLAAARMTHAAALILLPLAAITLAITVIISINPYNTPYLPELAITTLLCAIAGIALLAFSTSLQLQAATSLALRDLALHHPRPTPGSSPVPPSPPSDF